MKKRVLSIVFALTIGLSLVACGGAKEAETASVSSEQEPVSVASSEEEAAEETVSTEPTEAPEEENIEDSEEYKELAALGDVEVDNGILSVKITMPADIVGETTQEELNESIGDAYLDAKLNDDGSVTYKITKAQHKQMLDSIKESIKESIDTIVNDDENYSISNVSYNDDFTEFKVTIDGDQVGLGDYYSVVVFYTYGGMYGIMNGKEVDNVKVDFLDTNGNVIETANSSDMEDAQ